MKIFSQPSVGWFRAATKAAAALAVLGLAGCRGAQSALDPAGPQAGSTSGLWWLFFTVCGAVYVAVVVALLLALTRRKAHDGSASASGAGVILLSLEGEQKITRVVGGAVAITVVILLVFLFADYAAARALSAAPAGALNIKVTGHQWWWQFEYQDPNPSKVFQTANELHIPTGRPVNFILQSTDVIHSFWLPNFNGKKDLIPGHPATTWFTAEREGTFFGQCAEFCGYQHAHMRIALVAESPEKFAAWQEAQRSEAPNPANDRQRRGQQVFVTTSCAMCHSITGTPARSNVGPNLTHFASRPWFAAGAFPTDHDHLVSWLIDPQAMKPGVRMPAPSLTAEDREAVVEYLLNLK
jgi:cytochrome c oxidase subunit 2